MSGNVFTFVEREFFETISNYKITSEYVDELKALLPEDWNIIRSGVWVAASNGMRYPPQGFKIHISSIPKHAREVLRLVVPECVRREVHFKIAGDPNLLNLLNSKLHDRGHSGKFMTIYPPTDEAFKELIEAIYQKTQGRELVGPYILSDRRYKDSKILFYRYGGFQRIQRLSVDGSRTPLIRSSSGGYVPDRRLPYFHLLEGVEDPFGGSAEVDYAGEPVLRDRYEIEGPLSFSNAGGVYAAKDRQTGRDVIVKEARPFTNDWSTDSHFIDSVSLLHREWKILRRLEHFDFIPKPVDFFVEWEHTFLVEERLEAPTFWQYWTFDENLLSPYVRRPGRIESFVHKFRAIAQSLIETVEAVHQTGVILGDLSPRNVLVYPDELRVALIDFESAIVPEDDEEFKQFARRWITPGYGNPERRTRNSLEPKDDLYSLGMILYSAVVPVQSLFDLSPKAKDVFIREFVRLGVPGEVQQVITSLVEGNAEKAKELLHARWAA
jgi:hypothetical protein